MRTCTSSWLATVVLFFGEDISDRLKSLVTCISERFALGGLDCGDGGRLLRLQLPYFEAELPKPYFGLLGTA